MPITIKDSCYFLPSVSLSSMLILLYHLAYSLDKVCKPLILLFLTFPITVGTVITSTIPSRTITASNSIKVNPFYSYYHSYLSQVNSIIIYLDSQFRQKKKANNSLYSLIKIIHYM